MDETYWREKLETLKQELVALDAESKESRSAVELDQQKVGRLSRMDALQSQALNQAVAGRRRQMLVRIDQALERLEEEEFGYCQKCGDDIALERLELDPTTLLCRACATGQD